MIVKICGITRVDDAAMVAEAGADWIGLNFWPRSRRFVNRERGTELAAAARAVNPRIVVVGVFVNQLLPGGIDSIAAEVGLDYVQLHGDETPEDCARFGERAIKALALAEPADVDGIARFPGEVVLVDTPSAGYGGSGQTFDWSLARAAVATGRSVVLAGGLDPDNVSRAVAEVAPFGVDVASGVESAPGHKDAARVRAFVANAKGSR